MHGLVLNSFGDFCERRGVKRRDDVGPYSDEQAYPDEVFADLVRSAAAEAGVSESALLHEFGVELGTEFFPSFAPAFYERHSSLKAALLSVEDEIHERVRSALPGSGPPHLSVRPLGDDGVVIAYTSDRRLCALLEGLVEGTARRFDTPVEITHPQCMLHGETSCSVIVQTVGRP